MLKDTLAEYVRGDEIVVVAVVVAVALSLALTLVGRRRGEDGRRREGDVMLCHPHWVVILMEPDVVVLLLLVRGVVSPGLRVRIRPMKVRRPVITASPCARDAPRAVGVADLR